MWVRRLLVAWPLVAHGHVTRLSSSKLTVSGSKVTGIVEDQSEGPLVYDPGHPDADDAGYVRMPNVRITDEMVDLMDARRVFEANATVFQSAKQMLRRAIDI